MRHSRGNREAGLFHVPMALALLIITGSGFGIWGVQRQWKKNVELQLALDRCVESEALALRSQLRSLASANVRIRAIRQALAASSIVPKAAAALRVALTAQVAMQEANRATLALRQAWARAPKRCGGAVYAWIDAPMLVRDPPDLLGPRPLRWLSPQKAIRGLRIQAGKAPRHSAALVALGGRNHGSFGIVGIDLADRTDWEARWTAPGISIRTGVR